MKDSGIEDFSLYFKSAVTSDAELTRVHLYTIEAYIPRLTGLEE